MEGLVASEQESKDSENKALKTSTSSDGKAKVDPEIEIGKKNEHTSDARDRCVIFWNGFDNCLRVDDTAIRPA